MRARTGRGGGRQRNEGIGCKLNFVINMGKNTIISNYM